MSDWDPRVERRKTRRTAVTEYVSLVRLGFASKEAIYRVMCKVGRDRATIYRWIRRERRPEKKRPCGSGTLFLV